MKNKSGDPGKPDRHNMSEFNLMRLEIRVDLLWAEFLDFVCVFTISVEPFKFWLRTHCAGAGGGTPPI